jgi:K319-like protein
VFLASGIEVAALEIIRPAKGSVVRPGATMRIQVTVPPGLPVAKVTYTLMEEDRAIEDKVESPLSTVADSAPFEADMTMPPEAVGSYRILAVAQIKERRGFYVLFDEATFRIEPEAPLTSLRAESPLRFRNTIGEVQFLSVRGLYTDGVVRDLVSAYTGTNYRSSDEALVRTNGDGRAQALREGRAEIKATNSGKEVPIRVVVEVRETENRPPVADAGPDQTVRQGTRVRLDAIRSADPEGENPFYYWSQVKGMPIDLVEPLSLRPYFTAPVVTAPRVLRFRLIVRDKEEAESFPAYVNVTVVP